MHEQVIRGDAGLAGVVAFPPDDASGGDVEIGVLVDDAGALAAELERYRRQVFGRGLHDDASDRAVACIEDVVEPFREQCGCLGDSPFDHLTHSGSTYRGKRVAIKRLMAGTISLGFTIGAVAGGDGAHERDQQELERVVPGTDDEDDAQGLGVDPASTGLADQGCRHALGFGPGAGASSWRGRPRSR